VLLRRRFISYFSSTTRRLRSDEKKIKSAKRGLPPGILPQNPVAAEIRRLELCLQINFLNADPNFINSRLAGDWH
jgi:hypothetical protein